MLVAVSVVASGWPVIPLRPDTRTPYRSGGEGHRGIWATTVAEVLAAAEDARLWAHNHALDWHEPSWGVILGEPNPAGDRLVVLDTDSAAAEAKLRLEIAKLARGWDKSTATVRSARGVHRYGTTREEVRTSKPWPEFDLKAAGGYMVLPSCRHPSGARYADTTTPAGTVTTGGAHPGGAAFYRGVELNENGEPCVRWSVPRPIPDPLLRLLVPAPEPSPAPEPPATPRADDAYTAAAVVGIEIDLLAARGWPEGHTDARGRGWEKLCADAAYRLAQLALAEWSTLTLDRAHEVYVRAAPTDGTWTAAKVGAKWRAQLSRAKSKPLPLPAAHDAESPDAWGRVDLTEIIAQAQAGTLVLPVPTVGAVENSLAGLFYECRVNGIAGESGAGKSWIAKAIGIQQMWLGRRFIYVDFEDSPETAVVRLLAMGATPELITELFDYHKPASAKGAKELAQRVAEMDHPFIVLDSTGESMSLAGAKQNDDNETAAWFQTNPRPLAEAGGTVVLLDHQTKADDGGMWPIGSHRKRAGVTGVQYMVQIVEEFSREKDGCTKLVVSKDRHGARAKGEVASFVQFTHPIESTTTDADGALIITRSDRLTVTFGPGRSPDEVRADKVFRAAKALSADVAELDRLDPVPKSQRDVQDRMGWGGTRALTALREWRGLH